jgi:hypothetical protein
MRAINFDEHIPNMNDDDNGNENYQQQLDYIEKMKGIKRRFSKVVFFLAGAHPLDRSCVAGDRKPSQVLKRRPSAHSRVRLYNKTKKSTPFPGSA